MTDVALDPASPDFAAQLTVRVRQAVRDAVADHCAAGTDVAYMKDGAIVVGPASDLVAAPDARPRRRAAGR